MKVFLATVTTETNTFAPNPTGMGAFAIERRGIGGDAMTAMWPKIFDALAAASGHDMAIGLLADAAPGGVIVKQTYEALRDELLEDLRNALPVDAVILPLHGAMVADGYPDCEGDILTRVRRLVGPTVAVGVLLDLHCHFTAEMQAAADVIVGYKEYPHTDIADRAKELWHLTLSVAGGEVKPTMAVYDCRMVSRWLTTSEPMKSVVRRMKDLERADGVLSVSFGHGFVYGDVAEAGAKVWVVSDGNQALAERLAHKLGRQIWDARNETRPETVSLSTALDRLQARLSVKPIVIADVADNSGGGASSDSTFVLQGLLDREIGKVALGGIWDLGAVHICVQAGVGSKLALRVGGKCGPASGDPVDLLVTVRAVSGPGASDVFPTHLFGQSVWVSTEDEIDLVLISTRQQPYCLELFTGLGIRLEEKSAVVVKSTQHFRAAFEPIASEILYVDTPGLLRSDFAAIPYRHRDPNFWPRVVNPWAAEESAS